VAAIVNAEKIAQALNLTESRVHQLVKEGLPKEGRGQYDAVKCIRWYLLYLQNLIEKRAAPALDGAFAGEQRERVRLLRAAADLKEIRLAEQRSQLVAVSDVEAVTEDLVRTTTAVIMAIAPRLAPELVGETSRVMIQAKLERACKEALAYLAKSASHGPRDGHILGGLSP
jgi:phage terminase Nu1 subunit (DNA packaging protein)